MSERTILTIETKSKGNVITLEELRNFVDRAERNGIAPEARVQVYLYSSNYHWINSIWAERDMEQV